MAKIRTDVDLNVKSTGAKKAAKDLSSVGSALQKLGAATGTTTKGSDNLTKSQTRLGQASASSARQFSAQAQGLGGLVGAYAGAAATIFALQQAFSALNRAAQSENIIRGTQTLAAQIGESGDKIITSLQGITEGQLSMVEAAEKANMALASGFNTEQIERLTNVAQKASRALGRNLNEAFERLVRGSAKLEPELLDELGIFTRLDPAVDAYAKQLNKTSAELTSFERRQAFVNAVIEEGERKFSAIDTTAPSAQKSLEQLSTTLSDLGTKFGLLLAKALVPVATFFTEDLSAAIAAFALVARQISQVGFGMIGDAANRAVVGLQSFAANTLVAASSTEKSKGSLISMNSALTEMDRTFARGSLSQVKAAQAMFTTMKAGELTVGQLSEAQKILEQQIRNTNIALEGHKAKLAQLAAQNKQSSAGYQKLAASVKQGEKDLIQYKTALGDVKSGAAEQTKATALLAGGMRVFSGVVKVASVALRGLMAALNAFFLITAFGPIIMKLAGNVEFFDNIIKGITERFNRLKEAQNAVKTGIATFAADASLDVITAKYKTLGVEADQAAKNQREVVSALEEAAVEAREVGFMDNFKRQVSDFMSGVPLIGRLFEKEEIQADIAIADTITDKLKNLKAELLIGNVSPEEALNIRQQIESLQALDDTLGEVTFGTREFAGSLASMTGLNSADILNTLDTSANKLSVSIKGLVIATRDDLNSAFKLVNNEAVALITQFASFQTVLNNASDSLQTIGTPPKELIAFGQQLTNSQANLGKALEDNKARIANTYEIIKQAGVDLRRAQRQGDQEAEIAARTVITLAELEREALVQAYKATTNIVNRDKERIELLKEVSGELEKQANLYDEIRDNFGSEISTFENYEAQGKFSIAEDGSLNMATSDIEVTANKMQFLIDKVTTFKNESASTLTEVSAQLAEKFSEPFKDVTGNLIDGFDRANESIFEFANRVKGAKIDNMELAGAVAQVLGMEQNLETAAKAVLGTFMQQIKAAKDLIKEVNKLNVKLRQSATVKAANAMLGAAKAEMQFQRTKFQLQRQEEQLANRLMNAEYEGRKIALDGRSQELQLNETLIDARQEALQIEKEMADLRIEAAKYDLEIGKQLLDIGNKGVQESSLFGDDFKSFIDIITDLGNASLDIGVAEKDVEKADNNLDFLAQQAELDQARIENRMALDAIETEQRMLEIELDRQNIDFRAKQDIDALNFRLKQVQAQRRIAIFEAQLGVIQRQWERQRVMIDIKALQKRIQDTIQYIKASQKFIKDLKEENKWFLENFKMIADNLAMALGGGPSGPISERASEQREREAAAAAQAQQQAIDSQVGGGIGVDDGLRGAINANTAASAALPGAVSNAVQGSMQNRAANEAQGAAIGAAVAPTIADANQSTLDFISREEGGYGTGQTYQDETQISGPYGMRMPAGTQLTREEAYNQFEDTVGTFSNAVDALEMKYDNYDFNDAQKQALTSFAYNLGADDLERVTANGTRSIDEIGAAMLEYYNVESNDPRKEESLKRRRARESAMFLGQASGDIVQASQNFEGASQRIQGASAQINQGMGQVSQQLQNVPSLESSMGVGSQGGSTANLYKELSDSAVVLDDLWTDVNKLMDLEESANKLISDFRMAELDLTEESVGKQLEQRKRLHDQEVKNNLSLMKIAKRSGEIAQQTGLIEQANAANRAALERAKAMEGKRKAAIELEMAKMVEVQKNLTAMESLGGFLEKISVGDAEKELEEAEEKYAKALEKRQDKLERYNSAFDKFTDSVEKGLDIIDKRRETEEKYLETVGLGIDGAKQYYKVQEELLKSVQDASDQTQKIREANLDRVQDTVQLALAEYDLALAAEQRRAAEDKLGQGWRKVVGDIGDVIGKVGQLGSALISLSNVIAGLTRVSGQGGGIFAGVLNSFGFGTGNVGQLLKGLPQAISDGIMAPLKILAMTDGGVGSSSPDALAKATQQLAKVNAASFTVMDALGGAVLGSSVATSAFKSADPEKAAVGGAIGGALGSYLGSLVAASISGTAFGASLGAALGPIGSILGGILGSLLGGLLGNLFTKKKFSGASINLGTGATSSYGEKGGSLSQITNLAGELTDIVEQASGGSVRGTLSANFVRKGDEVRQKDLQMTTASGVKYTKGIADDGEQLSKDLFELITKGLSTTNADVARALSRLNFEEAIERNVEKLNFASQFGDLVDNLSGAMKGAYVSIEENIDAIAKAAAQNLDEITGGLMSNFKRLRKEASEVFGEASSQVRELDAAVQAALLETAGISVVGRNVSLIESAMDGLNNMAIIFANLEGEMLGFKDALVDTGMSAAEADRILREGATLRMRKVAEDFYESLNRADQIASGIDPKIYEDTAEVFKFQADIIKDAQTIKDKFPTDFANAVNKAEELAVKQRLRLISESSDEQLRAIRELTSATGEFADSVTQATVQAEIAARTLLGVFNTSELQKSARRSESRLSFNFQSVGLASGGPVPGTGAQQNKDSVPAMLMPGEYVIKKDSAKKLGISTLDALNSGNFRQMSAGGRVQTDTRGGTTSTGSSRSSFAAYETGGSSSVVSFDEAAMILVDANESLYNSYLSLISSSNSNTQFNKALKVSQTELADGNILMARAIFDYTTGIRDAKSITESYNQIVAESRTADIARSAGLISNIQDFDEFTNASNSFFEAIQEPKEYLQQSEGLYKKLYQAQNELNKLVAEGAINSDEYTSAIDSLNSAYDESIEKVKEYNDFFINLNDSLDLTGAQSQVRDLATIYAEGFDTITYAVEDGVIDTIDAYQKEVELNKLFNKQRLDLIENATEEQLRVLRDAQNTAEDYVGGISTIIDFTYQAGAAAELLTRQLNAVSASFANAQVGLVDFYNSTIDTVGGFGSRLAKSVESVFLEAGIEFDDALTNFYGSIGPFVIAAQRGSAGLSSLQKSIGELNYQLQTSEDIDIETYKTGISILKDTFMDFINTFQEMRDNLDTTKSAMEEFGETLYNSFNDLQNNITALIEGMVSNYRSNFESLKGLFDDAVSNQSDAEQELFDTLFAAQDAFESAGGNLKGHVDRIDDIVKGLDPAYTGYAGLDQYLLDLRTDIQNGTASIADIDVSTPLAQLQANLQTELASLTALQALPDSADKFVRISRQLSKITDIEEQIAQSKSATDELKESALALVDVERELNKNNLSASLKDVDLTTTELFEDLVQRAVDARTAYNDANAVLDGYNAALATNTTFLQGLADVVPSVNDQISNFTARLSDVSTEFADVQTAIADVTAAGLTDSLDNIVFNTDAYNVSVQPFADSKKALTDLNDAISEYQDIVAAKNAYEALYGAIGTASNTLPLDEFTELNNKLTTLEANLLAAAQVSIDPTISAISQIDAKFKDFIIDAIELFETPIQLDLLEPNTSSSSVAGYTVGTGTSGSSQFGTSSTNAILQNILTQGLGVQSPGYLYYANLFLEDIKDILSEMLVLQGGTLPDLNDPTVIPATNGSSSAGSGTVYAGPDYSNLSGLTGQLFSVQEPIALPADYFYIVVPQIIKLLDMIEIVENDIALKDLITIIKEEHNIYNWVNITKVEETWKTFFTINTLETDFYDWLFITKIETKLNHWITINKTEETWKTFFTIKVEETNFYEWFTIVIQDTQFDDWVNIIKQDHDYRTWFNQPTVLDTNALKWFNIRQSDTTWDAWYAPPTLVETSFTDWFTISDTKASTSAYDWFVIEQKAIKYIDFFDLSEKIKAVEFVEKSTVTSGDFFNISKVTTDFNEWFLIGSKPSLTFEDFFNGIAKGDASSLRDWFELENPLGVSPDKLYTLQDPIETSPDAFYVLGDPIEAQVSNFLSFTGVVSVDPVDVINVNTLNKILISYPDIFEADTETLRLTDMFDNYKANSGFEFDKARVSANQVIDFDYLQANGFDNKIKVRAIDLIANATSDGELMLAKEEDKVKVAVEDLFHIEKIIPKESFLEEFYVIPDEKKETNFFEWFEVPNKINIANIFEVFQAIPLDLNNAFDLSNSREPIAPSQIFTLSPNPSTVSASQLFEVNQKKKVTGDEAFEFVPFELAASEVISFDYLRSKPLQVAAIDILKVNNKVEMEAADYLSLNNKLTLDAIDAIELQKSTFDLTNIINFEEFTVDVNELVQLGEAVKAPGSSFYAISAPTALPAATFIGVDGNNKINLTYANIFDVDRKSRFGLEDIFDNFEGGLFDWVKTALAVTDIIDVDALTTSGLVRKVTLGVSDIIENVDSGNQLELSSKMVLSVKTFYTEPEKENHDYSTWWNAPKQKDTNFDEWFIMNEGTKLDLGYLVDNSVPLNYNDVFNFNYTTKVKVDDWASVVYFDAAMKVTKSANDIFDVTEGTYNAVDLIAFDPLETTVSALISVDYLKANKLQVTASDVLDITLPIKRSAESLINIISPLDIDLNENVKFEPVEIDGKDIYTSAATEIAGNRLFTPTQAELTGAAFFTPIANGIDANDLFIIDKKVPIDVSATFESDFANMQRTLDSMLGYVKTNEHNTSNAPKDIAGEIYSQIFDYYQNTFLKSYYDQWTPDIAKLPDMDKKLATANLIAEEIAETLASIWQWIQDFLHGKIESIETELITANSHHVTTHGKLDKIVDNTAEIINQVTAAEITLDSIEDYSETIAYYIYYVQEYLRDVKDNTKIVKDEALKQTSHLSSIEDYAKLLEDIKLSAENIEGYTQTTMGRALLMVNSLSAIQGYVEDIELNTDDLSKLDELETIRELLESVDLALFNISTQSNYLDDIEKVLREQIHLQDFKKLLDMNAVRYVYSGASTLRVPGYKDGGLVEGAGTGTSDSITAKLSNGEFVMKANAVSSLGTDFLESLNSSGSISDAVSALGIKGDTQVAHINDAEASLLKSLGGSGSVNSRTGLKQYFFDGYNPLIPIAEESYSKGSSIVDNTNIGYEGYSPEKISSNNYWNRANYPTQNFAKQSLVYAAQYIAATRDNKNITLDQAKNAIGDLWFEYDRPNKVQFNRGSYFNNGSPSSNDYNAIVTRLKSLYPAFANGGMVSGPGTGVSDSILAMLSDGEYVVRNSSVDSVGENNLEYINRTGNLPQGDTNVEINITNNGQPVDVQAEPVVRRDGDKIVVDVVLKDLRTNGPIKRAIKKVK